MILTKITFNFGGANFGTKNFPLPILNVVLVIKKKKTEEKKRKVKQQYRKKNLEANEIVVRFFR